LAVMLIITRNLTGWPQYLLSWSQGNGLAVSTTTVVADSIPAFSTCLFHVVPRVLGCVADKKTGPVVATVRTNKTGTNCVHLFGGPECNYWIALMYYEI
jgi:hypothetical protein